MSSAPPRPQAVTVAWVLFGFRGRLSRQIYWMGYFLFIAVDSVLVAQIIGGESASFHDLAATAFPVVAFITLVSNIAVAVKRLHDFGTNGLFALALLVPFVNIAFTIWAGLVPGNPGPNRYGAAPDIPPA